MRSSVFYELFVYRLTISLYDRSEFYVLLLSVYKSLLLWTGGQHSFAFLSERNVEILLFFFFKTLIREMCLENEKKLTPVVHTFHLELS